jgi:AcrR family transcriptional regulator
VKRRKAEKEGRLSAADWEEAALRAIAEKGVAAVAVEPLARTLGVTKGSLYWHFRDRDALLSAALRRWEERETEAVIATLAEVRDARERLQRLIGAVAARGRPSVHTALSAAADDPLVQPVLRRVSERRLGYVADCYRALGLPAEEARHQALLAYAAYVGFLHLRRENPAGLPSGAALERYVAHLVELLVPARGQK